MLSELESLTERSVLYLKTNFYYVYFWNRFKDIQQQQQQTKKERKKNDASSPYKKINQKGERSSVEKNKIQIIGTKPSSNYHFFQLVEKLLFYIQVISMLSQFFIIYIFFQQLCCCKYINACF